MFRGAAVDGIGAVVQIGLAALVRGGTPPARPLTRRTRATGTPLFRGGTPPSRPLTRGTRVTGTPLFRGGTPPSRPLTRGTRITGTPLSSNFGVTGLDRRLL